MRAIDFLRKKIIKTKYLKKILRPLYHAYLKLAEQRSKKAAEKSKTWYDLAEATRTLELAQALTVLAKKCRRAHKLADFRKWANIVLVQDASMSSWQKMMLWYRRRKWCQRAWWGCAANHAVVLRFTDNRLDEVNAVLLDTDVTRLTNKLQNSGVLVASVHLGPPVVRYALFKKGIPLLSLSGGQAGMHFGDSYINVTDKSSRLQFSIAAAQHLKQRGVVLMAPEGNWGSAPVTMELLGMPAQIQMGLPRLAKLLQVPSLGLFSVWHKRKIRLLWQEFPTYSPEIADWEQYWTKEYLRAVEMLLKQYPETVHNADFCLYCFLPNRE